MSRSAWIGLAILTALCGTARADWAQNPNQDLFDLSIEELMDVVYTSSRRAQEASQAAAKVYVISEETIRHSGAQSLDQILRRVPGLQVRTWLWGFTNTSIRGLLGGSPINERLLWLVDGVQINDVRDGGIWIDLTVFPLDLISRIEVMPGPQSSMYGGNAFQGVINIITKEARDVSAGGEYSLGAGRDNTILVSAAVPTSNGPLESLLSASYTSTDEHRLVSDHSGKDTWWMRGRSDVGATHVSYGGRTAEINYPSIFANPYELYAEHRDELYFNARHELDLGERAQLHFQPSFHHWRDRFWNFGDVPGLQYSQSSFRLSGLIQFHAQVRESDRLTLGAVVHREEYAGDDFRASKQDLRVTKKELYGEYEAGLGQRLRVLLGANIRDAGEFANDENVALVHPRVSVLLRLTKTLGLRGVYSTGYRSPSWWHLFVDTVDAEGNPGLHAEELRGLELGLDYELPAGRASAYCFSQRVKDGILEVYDPTLADPDYSQYGIFGKFRPIQATGEFNISGLDLQAESELLGDRLTAAGAYSYLRSRQPDARKTPYDAEHKFSIFTHAKPNEHITIGYGLHFVGETVDAELEYAPVDPGNPDSGLIGRRPVDAYRIHELTLSYTFAKGVGLSLSAWDLGHDSYEQYLGSEQGGNLWLATLRYGQ